MFDAVRNNRIVVQGILGLIVLTFAFFGIESYLGKGSGEKPLAEVAGQPISRAEFEQELRRHQDRLRAQLGAEADLETLNSPAVREQVLDSLINRRLLTRFAQDQHLAVPDAQLQDTIAKLPAFQEDGRFSKARYQQILASQGMTQPGFEAQMRQDLAFQQIIAAVGGGAVASLSSTSQLLGLQLEERKMRVSNFNAGDYAKGVAVSDEEIAAYYEANKARFERAARAKAEYVIFSRDGLRATVKPEEKDVRQWYDAHQGNYGMPEERGARHILIQVAPDAKPEAVEAAKAKAESIVVQLREKDGKNFAELAKAESQDPGSAANGGDLGSFSRGMMVKPFEDAVFSLKPGEISDPVRTDFGFHVIQTTSVKPSSIKPFDEVRGQIEDELRGQAAARKFAEQAEAFSNVIYEQPDSLKPAAEQFKLEIHTTDWISKGTLAPAPFDNKRLLDAVFSTDVLDNHHNSEAIDLGDARLVAARVVSHEPAKLRPMEDVRGEIVATLTHEKAAKAAASAGEAALESLKKGQNAALEFSPEQSVRRAGSSLSASALRAVFSVDSSKLPAYAGAATADGFQIFQITEVKRDEIKKDDPRVVALRKQYEQLIGERDLAVFLSGLRKTYGVEINQGELQKS